MSLQEDMKIEVEQTESDKAAEHYLNIKTKISMLKESLEEAGKDLVQKMLSENRHKIKMAGNLILINELEGYQIKVSKG